VKQIVVITSACALVGACQALPEDEPFAKIRVTASSEQYLTLVLDEVRSYAAETQCSVAIRRISPRDETRTIRVVCAEFQIIANNPVDPDTLSNPAEVAHDPLTFDAYFYFNRGQGNLPELTTEVDRFADRFRNRSGVSSRELPLT
jgi:hypothetical protein